MKTIMKELDFLKKKVIIYKKIWKKERLLLLANKLIKNIPDLCSAEKHESFWRKKKRKSGKQSEIIIY